MTKMMTIMKMKTMMITLGSYLTLPLLISILRGFTMVSTNNYLLILNFKEDLPMIFQVILARDLLQPQLHMLLEVVVVVIELSMQIYQTLPRMRTRGEVANLILAMFAKNSLEVITFLSPRV